MSTAQAVSAFWRGGTEAIRTLGNVLLGFAYLYACCYLAVTAPKEQVIELGNVFLMMGVGVCGVVAGRVVQDIQRTKHAAMTAKNGGEP